MHPGSGLTPSRADRLDKSSASGWWSDLASSRALEPGLSGEERRSLKGSSCLENVWLRALTASEKFSREVSCELCALSAATGHDRCGRLQGHYPWKTGEDKE